MHYLPGLWRVLQQPYLVVQYVHQYIIPCIGRRTPGPHDPVHGETR